MNSTNEELWNIDEFLAATQGRPVGEMPSRISGISIDSRTLQSGDAFFAIKGDNFDGHAFTTLAAGNGAVLAVVCEDKISSLGALNLPIIIVGDVLEALGLLAAVARARSKARIIAITGSVGKTTTKEMMRTLLEPCGKVHASVASYNNHWGVPLTLSRMRRDTDYAIFEIGMNHPGEITPLVKMVRPHIGIVTTIAAAHLGFFDNIDEIAKAKGEIFAGIENGGYALINRDINQYSLLRKMAKHAGVENVLGFGEKRGASFGIKSMMVSSSGSKISARLDGTDVELELGLPGKHMVTNLVAALGAAQLAGCDMDLVLGCVGNIVAVKGRGKSLVFGEGRRAITVIDESYNANPASMAASLNVLGMQVPLAKGRRVAVLGDMLELGKSAHKLHKGLATPIREANVERIWLVGDEMSVLADEIDKDILAGHFETAEKMKEALLGDLTPGDVIMFKASLGIKFGPLVEALTSQLAGE